MKQRVLCILIVGLYTCTAGDVVVTRTDFEVLSVLAPGSGSNYVTGSINFRPTGDMAPVAPIAWQNRGTYVQVTTGR